MAAGTKSVMLALLDTFPLHLHHNNGSPLCQERRFMMLSCIRGGTNNIVRARQKQIAPTVVAALIESEKRDMNTTTITKLTAEVAVRSGNNNNNNKVFASNMKTLVNIFRPTVQPHANKGLVLQLVSTHQLGPNGTEAKLSEEIVLEWPENDVVLGGEGSINTYKVEFCVDSDFGVPGAVAVLNRYHSELFLDSINIQQLNLHFPCKSWVQPVNKIDPHKRIFFFNKVYLPFETPIGLKQVRERELRQMRGDGRGHRKSCDRIYEYDVYNDLGDPDKGYEYERPTLGGQNNPYPTRCRTGRPPTRIGNFNFTLKNAKLIAENC
ncbi:hypothetical protein AHAS_Ahas13G0411500 [Arachis hypogaea]